jgi:hypothetical protein
MINVLITENTCVSVYPRVLIYKQLRVSVCLEDLFNRGHVWSSRQFASRRRQEMCVLLDNPALICVSSQGITHLVSLVSAI